MGYSIYFGVKDTEYVEEGEEGGVRADPDFSNYWGISYSCADSYFNQNQELRELWYLLRDGDINGGNPVCVPLTERIQQLIKSHACKGLQDALMHGLLTGEGDKFVETR